MTIQERGNVRGGAIVLERAVALPNDTDVEVRIRAGGTPETGEPLESVERVESIASLPFGGMWQNREDMADSVDWVSQQRDQWNRYPDPAQ